MFIRVYERRVSECKGFTEDVWLMSDEREMSGVSPVVSVASKVSITTLTRLTPGMYEVESVRRKERVCTRRRCPYA